MAKIDIKHVFRLCPVRQNQWVLLGYCWQRYYFVDSRSSPFFIPYICIFIIFIFYYDTRNLSVMHYLDEFLVCRKESDKVAGHLNCIQSLCFKLGVPLAKDKTVRPPHTHI